MNELSARASSTASWLRVKVSGEIAKELCAPLDRSGELAERLPRKFLSRLKARSVLFRPTESGRLLQETAAFCEQAVSEWLAAAGPLAIQSAIEDWWSGTHRPDGLTRGRFATGRRIGRIFRSNCRATRPHTTMMAPSNTAWLSLVCRTRLGRDTLPLWSCILPLPWRKGALSRWFEEVCDNALAEYRRQVEALISVSVEDYIDHVARKVQQKIGERATRIAGYIGGGELRSCPIDPGSYAACHEPARAAR